jgi:hypothetical protein
MHVLTLSTLIHPVTDRSENIRMVLVPPTDEVRPACTHPVPCPSADSPNRHKAQIVDDEHNTQGWVRLCNGVIRFDPDVVLTRLNQQPFTAAERRIVCLNLRPGHMVDLFAKKLRAHSPKLRKIAEAWHARVTMPRMTKRRLAADTYGEVLRLRAQAESRVSDATRELIAAARAKREQMLAEQTDNN